MSKISGSGEGSGSATEVGVQQRPCAVNDRGQQLAGGSASKIDGGRLGLVRRGGDGAPRRIDEHRSGKPIELPLLRQVPSKGIHRGGIGGSRHQDKT